MTTTAAHSRCMNTTIRGDQVLPAATGHASPAQRVLDAAASDPAVAQLSSRLSGLERKLTEVQQSIATDVDHLRAALKVGTVGAAEASDRDLATLSVDLIVRSQRSIETLREQVRQQRMAEAELAEAVRIVRNRLRNRESAAFDEAHRELLIPEQVKLGAQVVDQLLSLSELWLLERALRQPLKTAAGRFERADIWATHCIDPGLIRDLIDRLERYGYRATAEQRRRLESIRERAIQ
jgi:acetolactate synthase regulatory subunit